MTITIIEHKSKPLKHKVITTTHKPITVKSVPVTIEPETITIKGVVHEVITPEPQVIKVMAHEVKPLTHEIFTKPKPQKAQQPGELKKAAATLSSGDDLLTEREAAAVLKVKPSTLRNDRAKGRGLPYVKIGALVRYTRADIMARIAANRHVPGTATE